MTRSALILSLAVGLPACWDIDYYALTRDRLILVSGSEVLSCALERPAFVGAPEYAPNVPCEAVLEASELYNGWYAGEDALVYPAALTRATASGPCLSNRCTKLVVFDLQTLARRELGAETPLRTPRIAGDWVVWIDLRHDQNGLCRWPEGDGDCAVDLYGFNQKTGTEHRLTRVSAVYPPGGLLGFDAFAIEGTEVIYVDARDPSCEVLGLHNGADQSCGTTLRAIDLSTFTERELAGADRRPVRVRAGEGGVAWLATEADGSYTLMYTGLAGGASIALGAAPLTLNYEVDREWVVYETGEHAIEGIRLASGERRLLSEPGEIAIGPVVRNRRVVWSARMNNLITVYDLERGRRSVLVDAK